VFLGYCYGQIKRKLIANKLMESNLKVLSAIKSVVSTQSLASFLSLANSNPLLFATAGLFVDSENLEGLREFVETSLNDRSIFSKQLVLISRS
jgi:hypothetical protein